MFGQYWVLSLLGPVFFTVLFFFCSHFFPDRTSTFSLFLVLFFLLVLLAFLFSFFFWRGESGKRKKTKMGAKKGGGGERGLESSRSCLRPRSTRTSYLDRIFSSPFYLLFLRFLFLFILLTCSYSFSLPPSLALSEVCSRCLQSGEKKNRERGKFFTVRP